MHNYPEPQLDKTRVPQHVSSLTMHGSEKTKGQPGRHVHRLCNEVQVAEAVDIWKHLTQSLGSALAQTSVVLLASRFKH